MKGMEGFILFFGFLICMAVVAIWVFIIAPIGINYTYNNEIGNYFELSDKASTIDQKLKYIEQYDQGLVRNGLDKGQSTVFFPTPETSLEENYKVLKSLEQRLIDAQNLSTTSDAYQFAILQITQNEYCWFHTEVFVRGYYIKVGYWIFSLFQTSAENRCATSSSK